MTNKLQNLKFQQEIDQGDGFDSSIGISVVNLLGR